MKKRRQVQLFNFSFVDILATTIGVLLFILIMAVLNLSGVVAHAEWAHQATVAGQKVDDLKGKLAGAQAAYDQAVADNTAAMNAAAGDNSAIADQISDLARRNRELDTANQALRDKLGQLQDQAAKLKDQKQTLAAASEEDTPANAGQYILPQAHGGAKAIPVHVDCRADGLIVIGRDVKSPRSQRITIPSDAIAASDGEFRNLVAQVAGKQHGPGREVLVLWIRQTGIVNAYAAIKIAKDAGAPLGWEPALDEWSF
jgi:hypothetical protein